MTKLMTTNEVAKYLSVTPQTVTNLINDGELPAIRIGKNWRIDPVHFQHYIHNAGTPTYQALVEQGICSKDNEQT